MLHKRLSRRSLTAGTAALAGFAAFSRISRANQPVASPAATPAAGPNLLLRMESSGGLQPIETLLIEVPEFSLFDDGSIYRLGPTTAVYPPAAIPNLTRMRISPEAVETIVARAVEIGLQQERTVHNTMVSDAPTTQFIFNDDGAFVTSAASALFVDTARPPDWTDDMAETYAALRTLGDYLRNIQSELPADAIIEQEMPIDPERLQVIAVIFDPEAPLPSGVPNPEQPSLTWPLSTSLDELGAVYEAFSSENSLPAMRCAALTGEDAQAVVDTSRDGNFTSPWVDGDVTYGLLLKPLLPDQTGCIPLDA